MVRLETRARRLDGVTLVEGRLHNDASEAMRVTVGTDLAPVYPPRSAGEPIAGWHPEEGRLTLLVAPGQRTGVGFASPAAADESPLRVVDTERAPSEGGGLPDTPAGVARALGDPLPPEAATGGAPESPRASDSERGTRSEFDTDLERLRRAAVEVARAATSLEERLGAGGGSGRAPPPGDRDRRRGEGGGRR